MSNGGHFPFHFCEFPTDSKAMRTVLSISSSVDISLCQPEFLVWSECVQATAQMLHGSASALSVQSHTDGNCLIDVGKARGLINSRNSVCQELDTDNCRLLFHTRYRIHENGGKFQHSSLQSGISLACKISIIHS